MRKMDKRLVDVKTKQVSRGGALFLSQNVDSILCSLKIWKIFVHISTFTHTDRGSEIWTVHTTYGQLAT